MNGWQFMHEHWFVTIVLACIASAAVVNVARVPLYMRRSRIRGENIKAHGWPTNPLMDAEGDIIHPPAPEAADD